MTAFTELKRRISLKVVAAHFAIAVLLLAVSSPGHGWQQIGPYHWTGVERIVAVGDIHGALVEFESLLVEAGITDADQNWIAGKTHFVAVGDYLDRGADSRKVMDLLRRLQPQAEAAGGKLHALLGNHEVMNMTGELGYVLAEEFASYADLEPENADQTGYQKGFLGHQRAFAPAGEYGAWLSTLPFIVVVNDTAFLHGGLSSELREMSLQAINQRGHQELASLIRARSTLQTHGAINIDSDFATTQKTAIRLLNTRLPAGETAETWDAATIEVLKGAARSYSEAAKGLPFSRHGPVWYRRTAMCHPYSEQQLTDEILAALGATRVVIGHTPTTGRTIHSRMGGRVLAIDTGMNVNYYKGHPAALIINGDQLDTLYLDLAESEPQVQANHTWARPRGMDDEAIADFMRTARVTLIEDLLVGITKPRRVTLEANGVKMRAVFKTLDTDPGLERSRWKRQADRSDRFIYDRAAYELDRILGLDMVPVAVTRTINNEPGLLQYWVEGAINEKSRREQNVGYTGYCSLNSQYALMNAFDTLIYNDDRTLANVLYTRRDWALWLIDHTRAFRSSKKIPGYIKKSHFDISPQLRAALSGIDEARLAPLRKYLHQRQIEAIEARAKLLTTMR